LSDVWVSLTELKVESVLILVNEKWDRDVNFSHVDRQLSDCLLIAQRDSDTQNWDYVENKWFV
jgi:hypothetical protein